MHEAIDSAPRGRSLRLDGGDYLLLSFRVERTVCTGTLTPAERAVATSILAGASNAQIACERKRSVRTVANQIASIFQKLGVSSRVELAGALARSENADAARAPRRA